MGQLAHEGEKCLNSELWHACAGPLVSLPTVGSRVVYFPQGHSEQVYKTGSVGRSLDIARFSSYQELRQELGQMFGIEGLLQDPQRSDWQLVFVDRENDVLLLGDDPWESFVNNVWDIKILSPEDVLKLGKEEAETLNRSSVERMNAQNLPSLGSLDY